MMRKNKSKKRQERGPGNERKILLWYDREGKNGRDYDDWRYRSQGGETGAPEMTSGTGKLHFDFDHHHHLLLLLLLLQLLLPS